MNNSITITQIVVTGYTDKNGNRQEDVCGLGSDGLMYRWHRGTGRWLSWVIQN